MQVIEGISKALYELALQYFSTLACTCCNSFVLHVFSALLWRQECFLLFSMFPPVICMFFLLALVVMLLLCVIIVYIFFIFFFVYVFSACFLGTRRRGRRPHSYWSTGSFARARRKSTSSRTCWKVTTTKKEDNKEDDVERDISRDHKEVTKRDIKKEITERGS